MHDRLPGAQDVRIAGSEPAAPNAATSLTDGFGRRIRHLRLSVISTCDLRCSYCRPADLPHPESIEHTSQESVEGSAPSLNDDQRFNLVAELVDRYGLEQVRITGGEPLLYRNVVSLLSGIRSVAPRVDLAMTTHGKLLSTKAAALSAAGLSRINISLDTLRPDRYEALTGGKLDDVLTGIRAAGAAGFRRIKLNAVVLAGINDDELADLATWAVRNGHELRFLEAMPIGPAAAFNRRHFVAAAAMRERLSRDFTLEPMIAPHGSTSRLFRIHVEDRVGVVGFVSPVTEPFCAGCGRIRITADGRMYPCLLDSRSVSLRPALSGNGWDRDLLDDTLRHALARKAAAGTVQASSMVTLGG